jgi:hypothetical protein
MTTVRPYLEKGWELGFNTLPVLGMNDASKNEVFKQNVRKRLGTFRQIANSRENTILNLWVCAKERSFHKFDLKTKKGKNGVFWVVTP